VFSLANEVTSTSATISGNFSGGEGGSATAQNTSRFRVADRAVLPGATNVFDSNGAATSFCSTSGVSCSNSNNSSETQPIFPASATLALPTDLCAFIDDGVNNFFAMWLFMSQSTSLQGCFGGSCIAEGRSSWRGSLTVEFLFDPAVVPVPAPATLGLLGASLIGLGAARRRRA